jgi:hypothetical protein
MTGRNAFQRKILKSNIVSLFEKKGYRVEATDTPNIVVFSDGPLTKRSKWIGDYICGFLTSFGEKEAEKILRGE